jgi:hypothetical protein
MATMSARLGRTRFIGLAAMNAGLGVMIAGSDILITTIFDVRYEMAAIILPILLLGCWFSIHGSLVETTLLGLGFPQPMVVGNMMRLLSTAVGLPLALSAHGLFLALIVISFADLPRYFWFTWQAFRKGVSFGGQEPTLFVMTVAIALVTRYILVHVGLVDGLLSSVQMQAIAKLL